MLSSITHLLETVLSTKGFYNHDNNYHVALTRDWLSWVRANDAEIMTVLENQASNLVKAATILAESISDYSTLKEKNSILKNLEHRGDELTHELFTIIDKTFVTPLDKEDISELTSTIDQVLDATYGTSDRMVLFKMQKSSIHMQELANLLLNACKEIHNAVTGLPKAKREDLIQYTKAISHSEHEGDNIYRLAIAELFDTNNAIEIIKSKDIYETLESALDRSRDVADVIEDIALKYR